MKKKEKMNNMLVSVFITFLIIGFLSFMMAVEKRKEGNLAYVGISFVIFIVLMAQSVFLEVPFIASSSTTADNQQHLDPAAGAICLLFVILNIILLLLNLVAWRSGKNEIAMP